MSNEKELKLTQGAVLLGKLVSGEAFLCGCGEEAVTECESCGAGLCDKCADFATYDDVDVCLDQDACANRIDANGGFGLYKVEANRE